MARRQGGNSYRLSATEWKKQRSGNCAARRIHGTRPQLAAETTWTSRTDTVFEGTYRSCCGRPRVAAGWPARQWKAAAC